MVLLALLTAIITCLSPFALPDATLDSSWAQALVEATDRGRIFGREIIFTFGPLHQAYTAELSQNPLAIIVARVAFFSLWFGVQLCVGSLLGLWTEAAIALAAAIIGSYPMVMPDSFFFLFAALGILLPVAVTIQSVRRPLSRSVQFLLSALLVVGIALSPLVKLSFVGSAIPAFLSIMGCQIVLCQRRPSARSLLEIGTLISLPFLSLGLAWTWLTPGSLADLVFFFTGPNRHVLSGYTEAMAYEPNKWNLESLPVYGLFVSICLLIEWKLLLKDVKERDFGRGAALFLKILAMATMVVLFWIVFKAFFVRDDSWRVVNARQWSMGILTVLIGITKPRIDQALKVSKREKMLLLVALPLVWFVSFYYPGILIDRIARGLRDTWLLLARKPYPQLLAKRKLALRAVRKANEDYRLPAGASADVIPWDITSLLANDLTYTPRPIPQSYSAYTTELQSLNREHALHAPTRADYLILTSKDIDGRLPIGLDSPIVLGLRQSYRFSHRGSAGSLVFKRVPEAGAPAPTAARTPAKVCPVVFQRDLGWRPANDLFWQSEAIVLPTDRAHPLVMNLEVSNSMSRAVLTTLYRPFKVTIDYLDSNNTLLERFRIVPRAGLDMLVDPLLRNGQDLHSFLVPPSGRAAAPPGQRGGRIAAIRFSGQSLGPPFARFHVRLTEHCDP